MGSTKIKHTPFDTVCQRSLILYNKSLFLIRLRLLGHSVFNLLGSVHFSPLGPIAFSLMLMKPEKSL